MADAIEELLTGLPDRAAGFAAVREYRIEDGRRGLRAPGGDLPDLVLDRDNETILLPARRRRVPRG